MSGRLPSLKPGDLDGAQRELYDSLMANEVPLFDKAGVQVIAPDGSLLGPFNPLLLRPGLGAAQIDVFRADKAGTSLSPRVHEIVILTVGAAWAADYELYAHKIVGRLAGLPEEVIHAVISHRPPESSGRGGGERVRVHPPAHPRASDRCRNVRASRGRIRARGVGRHGHAHRSVRDDLRHHQCVRGSRS